MNISPYIHFFLLRQTSGFEYTSKLQRMSVDKTLSKDLHTGYVEWQVGGQNHDEKKKYNTFSRSLVNHYSVFFIIL